MTKLRNPYARTISVTLTDVELLALTHALDRALDANREWQKCERYEADAPAEEADLLAKGDAVLTRLRGAYEIAKPRVSVRCTCDNGNSWATDFNGTLADARDYYLKRTFTVEDVNTGKERTETVVRVELEKGDAR